MKLIPRPEHPRPDFVRDSFFNLNGRWAFAFDDADIGVEEGWFAPGYTLDREIVVPFCYQCKASGIGPTDEIHEIMWYQRNFTIPEDMEGRRILLRFGAVDYHCSVYINGQMVGGHKGGYTPFSIDVTDYLLDGENDLRLRVVDTPDCSQPRGKQYWQQGLTGCWYTPVSGIWQTVYLEAVSDLRVEYIHIVPNIDNSTASFEIMLNKKPEHPISCEIVVSLNGHERHALTFQARQRCSRITLDMSSPDYYNSLVLWWPHMPELYDVRLKLRDGQEQLDQVDTYFGMRKIHVKDGQIYLNNRKFYQRLILDQGYWPDTLLTPPSDEAIQEDLRWTVAFGYNGARKHQKVEDPRYYYWADKMGVLVWGEVPSPYEFTEETVENLTQTTLEFIRRDFNHPSIICWATMNESWGVRNIAYNPRQQAVSRMLYHLTKAADGTRLCVGNDGWEQLDTDICGLHDYSPTGEVLANHFASRTEVETYGCDQHLCYVNGHTPTGNEAFMVTEYGGIAFQNKGVQGELSGIPTWGYHGKESDENAFFERFQSVTDAVREIPYCMGYCYTQLTDVMQEINGLLTPDRKPKVDPDRLLSINCNPLGRTDNTPMPQKKIEQ